MDEERITSRKTAKRWIVGVGFGLVVATVAVAVFLRRGSTSEEGRPVPAPTGLAVPAPSNEAANGAELQPGELSITLSPDRVESAQIKTELVTERSNTSADDSGSTRTTGIVQSNAYKETPVFPVAGGIVREVNAQPGDRVRRDQTLAVIFSTELADAEGEYLKKLAELEEHHKHHQRATELVEIGAISREEFEQAASNFKAAQANVSSTRQRLTLLGVTEQQADALRTSGRVKSLISVSSPASGTVINRAVNAGEVIDKSKELFRVADLSTVWVIGQVYEIDFPRVRVGTHAAMTTAAYPGRTFTGQVSYIDPRVDPNTRTAQVRIEVQNSSETLRLGMFVDIAFEGALMAASSGHQVAVPRAAVQSIGAKQVVFVSASQPGVFIQREVTAGPESNGMVPVYRGLRAGERVVTVGSFLLSAESLKLNPTQSMEVSASGSLQPASEMAHQRDNSAELRASHQQGEPAVQSAKVLLTKEGYKPSRITVRKGILVRLTFLRQVEETCGTEISIPEYNIKRELPLNEPIVIDFTPTRAGEIAFVCGMNMLRGTIVVVDR